MRDLITSTFTTDVKPNHLRLAEHFQHSVGFFDIDVSEFKSNIDGKPAWTVSLTYPVEHMMIYADKFVKWYGLQFFDNWIEKN